MAESSGKAGRDEGASRPVREALRRIRELTTDDAHGLSGGAPPLEGVADVGRLLRAAAGEHGELELVVSTNRLTLADDVVYRSDARDGNLAFELFRQGLRRITFRPGVTDDELRLFVEGFTACRALESVDEDFVSHLWRSSPLGIKYVALDGITERLFMSDEHATAAFREVVLDCFPDLLTLADDDAPDTAPRPRVTRDDTAKVQDVVERARGAAKSVAAPAQSVRATLSEATTAAPVVAHATRLLSCLALKPTCAVDGDIIGRALHYTMRVAWTRLGMPAFADVGRTLDALWRLEVSADLETRLRAVRQQVSGRDAVSFAAQRADAEQPEQTSWLRWYFVTAGTVTSPELLALISGASQPAAQAFLRDLLRRMGASSMEPWAEQLRSGDAQTVLEVLDVILGSQLGVQAAPLLHELLRHADPRVRAKAVESLPGAYGPQLREAVLPLLRDPEPAVRLAVLSRFLDARDPSVVPYVAGTIKAPAFEFADEDEQRAFMEALSELAGERALDPIRARLSLDENATGSLGRLMGRGPQALVDTPVRRAALAGLARLATPSAIALIRELQGRADLELAAHCEVAARLAQKGRPATSSRRASPNGDLGVEDAAAVVRAGEGALGGRLLFEPSALRVAVPNRPRPSPRVVVMAPSEAASAPLATASASTTAAPRSAPLAERPLLDVGEVFLVGDERRLRAEPGVIEVAGLRLTLDRVALVGADAAGATAEQPASFVVVAPRIVERQSARQAEDWAHQPEASLTDILADYLGDEPPPKKPSLDDVLKDFLDLDLEK